MTAETLDTAATHLEGFCEWLIDGRGNAASTAINYAAAIRDFYRRMELGSPESVDAKTLDRYAIRLYAAKLGLDTRRAKLTALRVYFRWLFTRGHLPTDLSVHIQVPRGRETRLIPVFSREEIRRLVEHRNVAPTPGKKEPRRLFERRMKTWMIAEARDPALISLSYSLGLRVSEVGDLLRDDLVTVKRRTYLTVREGKDSTEPRRFRLDSTRVVPYLAVYLELLDQFGIRHPALFPPLARNTHEDSGKGISPDAVAVILKGRVRAAGIDPHGRRISPHMLRYSRATHMYKQQPILEIQALLRHRAQSTTQRYIRLGSLEVISNKANHSLPWRQPDPLNADDEKEVGCPYCGKSFLIPKS